MNYTREFALNRLILILLSLLLWVAACGEDLSSPTLHPQPEDLSDRSQAAALPGKELDSEQATLSVSEAKDQDADKSQSPVDLAPHRTGLATPTPVILDEEPENAATQQDRDTGDQRDESLVTDSSGHQDAALSAEQLAERAVQLVAAREGVSTSYLEVIDSTRPSSPVRGLSNGACGSAPMDRDN